MQIYKLKHRETKNPQVYDADGEPANFYLDGFGIKQSISFDQKK